MVTLTIQRPTGVVEVVDVSAKFCSMNPALFARIVAANKTVGNIVLSYSETHETPILTPHDLEMREYDRHCAAMKKAMSY